MKKNSSTFIIGLDGLDSTHLFRLPYLNSLISKSKVYDLEEDLWVRGWSKILTGKKAIESKAFYNRPLINKSFKTTTGVGTKNYINSTPIWEILNSKNVKSGFINLPTTIPAPKVNGFFISGPGGGFDPSVPVPKEACFPSSLQNKLLSKNYIWEERWTCSKAENIEQFITLLELEINQKFDILDELIAEYDTDFNFIMLRTIDALSALIYPHIMNKDNKRSKLQNKIEKLFLALDSKIEQAIEKNKPENIIIVSDHGYTTLKYNININALLLETGHQIGSEKNKVNGLKSFLKETYGFLPNNIKKRMKSFNSKSSLISRISETLKCDPLKTKAFSFRYISGIYINDDRFYSVVKKNEHEKVIEEIIIAINKNVDLKRLGIKATTSANYFGNDILDECAPDIFLSTKSTGVFFTQVGDLLNPNVNIKTDISNLKLNKKEDQVQGTKRSKPILAYHGYKELSNKYGDLSQFYHIIESIYNK